MANYFIYNGVSSKDHSLKCKEISHFSFSAKSYESIKIPGRTGSLIIDDGSYENKPIPITAYLDLRQIPDDRPVIDYDPETNEAIYGKCKKDYIQDIKKWLIGHTGYKTLEFDDYMQYQAIVSGEVVWEELFNDYYQITINFECVEVLE